MMNAPDSDRHQDAGHCHRDDHLEHGEAVVTSDVAHASSFHLQQQLLVLSADNPANLERPSGQAAGGGPRRKPQPVTLSPGVPVVVTGQPVEPGGWSPPFWLS